MPAGLIEQDNAMSPRFDGLGNFCQVERHGLCVAAGQHQAGALALLGADGAEDVGRSGALIARCRGAGAALGPPAGDLVLLSDPVKPDLYVLAPRLLGGGLRQPGG